MMYRHVGMDNRVVFVHVYFTVFDMSKKSTTRNENDASSSETIKKITPDSHVTESHKTASYSGCRKNSGICNETSMSQGDSSESLLDEDLYGTSAKYLANLNILRSKLNLVRLYGENDEAFPTSASLVESANERACGSTNNKKVFRQEDVPELSLNDDFNDDNNVFKMVFDEVVDRSACWSASFPNTFSLETIQEQSAGDTDLESVSGTTTTTFTPPHKKVCTRIETDNDVITKSKSYVSSDLSSSVSIPCSVVEYYSNVNYELPSGGDLIEYKIKGNDSSLAINLPSSICDTTSSTSSSIEPHVTILDESDLRSCTKTKSKSRRTKTRKKCSWDTSSTQSLDSDDRYKNLTNKTKLAAPYYFKEARNLSENEFTGNSSQTLARGEATTNLKVKRLQQCLVNTTNYKETSNEKIKNFQTSSISEDYNIRHSEITQCEVTKREQGSIIPVDIIETNAENRFVNTMLTFPNKNKEESEGEMIRIDDCDNLISNKSSNFTINTFLSNTKSDSILVCDKKYKVYAHKMPQNKSMAYGEAQPLQTKGINDIEPLLESLEVPKMKKIEKHQASTADIEFNPLLTSSLTTPKLFSFPDEFPSFTKITCFIDIRNFSWKKRVHMDDDCNHCERRPQRKQAETERYISVNDKFECYKRDASKAFFNSKYWDNIDLLPSTSSLLDKNNDVLRTRKDQSSEMKYYKVPSPDLSSKETEVILDAGDSEPETTRCARCFCDRLFFSRLRKRFF